MSVPDALPWGAGVALATALGVVFGSFIATLVLRWPSARSVLGRSQCDGCARPLGARDLVPLLSAMLIRGRSRRSGAPIDPFHGSVDLDPGILGPGALAVMLWATGRMWGLLGLLLWSRAF